MKCNCGVKCNVTCCEHNIEGCNCDLKEVLIEVGNEQMSCCGSFKEKD